jgi:hypothetical protein
MKFDKRNQFINDLSYITKVYGLVMPIYFLTIKLTICQFLRLQNIKLSLTCLANSTYNTNSSICGSFRFEFNKEIYEIFCTVNCYYLCSLIINKKCKNKFTPIIIFNDKFNLDYKLFVNAAFINDMLVQSFLNEYTDIKFDVNMFLNMFNITNIPLHFYKYIERLKTVLKFKYFGDKNQSWTKKFN